MFVSLLECSPLRFNTAPLGAVDNGGAKDLFPRICKDFKVKSSIPQSLPCGGSLLFMSNRNFLFQSLLISHIVGIKQAHIERIMKKILFDFVFLDKYAENLFAVGFEGDISGNKSYKVITSFEKFEHFINSMEEIKIIFNMTKTIFFTTSLLPDPPPVYNQ